MSTLIPGTTFSTILAVHTTAGTEHVTRHGVIVHVHLTNPDVYRVEYTGASVANGRMGWLARADMAL